MAPQPRILLVDNYDSFVHNLRHHFRWLGAVVHVVRNDAISAEDVSQPDYDAIVLSPGPGRPENAGISEASVGIAVERNIPLLGVCLGMQAIVTALGGQVEKGIDPTHGKQRRMVHTEHPMFSGIEQQFDAVRYHSLIAVEASLPDTLDVTARTTDDVIMAIAHKSAPIWGVQFHPESVASPDGVTFLKGFLNTALGPKLRGQKDQSAA